MSRKRTDGKWRARYRDPGGREHARHFGRKLDAERWVTTIEADIVRGLFVDPDAGKVLFREYAERWRLAQLHRPTSAAHIETMRPGASGLTVRGHSPAHGRPAAGRAADDRPG